MRLVLLYVAVASAALLACQKKNEQEQQPEPQNEPAQATSANAAPAPHKIDPAQLAVFAPLPAKLEIPENPITDDKVALGKQLFFDARLSKGQDVSCNSCHDVEKSGADERPLSIGTKKQVTRYNAPTVFNAAGGFSQGWEARTTLVEDFVFEHASEGAVMGVTDEKELAALLSSIPGYAAAFKKVFPSEKAITAKSFGQAVGAYLRKLVTPSKWDRYLLGEQDALSDDEKVGLGTFIEAGCPTCHAGKYVGAAQNQKLGLAKPWPGDAGAAPGRYSVTKQEVDRGVFKVPSLRNVTQTAPYLHDGSVSSLDEMAKLMADHQVGKDITDAQAKSIVTFLGALAGEPPKDLATKPTLPPSGPKTPKPQ